MIASSCKTRMKNSGSGPSSAAISSSSSCLISRMLLIGAKITPLTRIKQPGLAIVHGGRRQPVDPSRDLFGEGLGEVADVGAAARGEKCHSRAQAEPIFLHGLARAR